MFEFIKYLHHKDPKISHVVYLYQEVETKKYYISFTQPSNDNIDNKNQFMLIDEKDNIIRKPCLKNIDKLEEVNNIHFINKKIGNYILS
jgi:hypothetical protein